MSDFDEWLFEIPWRLERYYGLVPGMTDEDRKFLSDTFEVHFMRASRAPDPLLSIHDKLI